MSRWFLLAVAIGLAVLALVLGNTDLAEVWTRMRQLRVWQVGTLVSIYFVGRLGGVASWLLTQPRAPATPRWLFRMLRVAMVGGAIERLTPLAGLGGEPAKAVLLKRDYGLRLRDATTSLVLTRMTDLLATLIFCSFGVVAIATNEHASPELRGAVVGAWGVCVGLALAFFAAQTSGMLSRVGPWLMGRWPEFMGRHAEALDSLADIEEQLIEFYRRRPRRFALSVAATFGEWTAETALIWTTLHFLGLGPTVADAVSIEAASLLVRTTIFFVPGDIGTMEAALAVMCRTLAGSSAVGLVIAAVLRIAELLWTVAGVLLGLHVIADWRRGKLEP